jgi:gamma-glutamylcyclotransferase (GGCT)/AIG2-like uncharacterized protein YtfP
LNPVTRIRRYGSWFLAPARMNTKTRSETGELPIFVYGTLRSGEANAWCFQKAILRSLPARLQNAMLFDLGPYPMIVENGAPEGAKFCVVGELVEVTPAHYASTLRVLDQLEGVDPGRIDSPRTLYRRVPREVRLEDESFVMAWVYIGREDLARRGRFVESGDWKHRFQK